MVPLKDHEEAQPFLDGRIVTIPYVHGRGLVGSMMAHGHGYFIQLPGEPSLYIAGDTILTAAVEACLRDRRPDIAVMPAGGARFNLGGDIIMGADDIVRASRISTGKVIANHLEALDHCPVTRGSWRKCVQRKGGKAAC